MDYFRILTRALWPREAEFACPFHNFGHLGRFRANLVFPARVPELRRVSATPAFLSY
jgi:hypothetical protein